MNPDKGQVEVQLGPKTYVLQFDNNAIRVFEANVGAGIAYVLENFRKLMGIDLVVKAIHAGLQYDGSKGKNLSLHRIADMLPPSQFEKAAAQVVKGILAWRGVIEPEDEATTEEGAPTVDANPT